MMPADGVSFDWSDFLHRHRDSIIGQWVHCLQTQISERYSRRPISELKQTVRAAFDANCRVLIHGDYLELNRFITEISRKRLEGGFPLVDVQKAFDLFRQVSLPILAEFFSLEIFHQAVVELNDCLAYTFYQFSDYFQNLHRRHLIDYARKLKAEVSYKTAELRKSELKYKTLVEDITDGVVVINNGIIVFTNQAFCAMHGYDSRDLMEKPFLDLAVPGDRQTISDRLCEAPANGEGSLSLEYFRITRSGDKHPTEIRFKRIHYGAMWSQIGICRDITERIELENKMRESKRLADIAQIATSLSHEIRNPLSAIKMNLQILQRHPELAGNDRRRVDIAVHEMHRLEGVLQEVLDFAKPVMLQKTPCSLNPILMQSIELLELKFAEKRLEILLDLSELPELLMDGQKIEQVALNLLLNAVEAAPDGSTIRISSTRWATDYKPPEVVFAVEDEGETIPQALCETIFTPYFTTKSRGSGLGLSVVRRLVEAHGGRVSVESRVPKGTVFTVTLPEGDIISNDSDQ
jgi:PAS domain S-box-containing protein